MTESQYPPLPEPAELGFEATEGVYLTGYTADDMRTYIDADRAQRKPLTDEECDAIAKALHKYAMEYDHWEFGLPVDDEEEQDGMRQAMRSALNTPPRQDTASKGETN